MLSDREMTLEQAAKVLEITPHQLSILIKKGIMPSRMYIGPTGKRERLLPRDAVDAISGTAAYRLLLRDSTRAPVAPDEPEPQPSPPPEPSPTVEEPTAEAEPEEAPEPEPEPLPDPAEDGPVEEEPPLPPVALPVDAGEDALKVALLQSLTATQERVATIERRLESLMGSIATDLAVKLAAVPTNQALRDVASSLVDVVSPISERVAQLGDALAKTTQAQSAANQQLASQVDQLKTELGATKQQLVEARAQVNGLKTQLTETQAVLVEATTQLATHHAAATHHATDVDGKLGDLFQVLEALPDILEQQGDRLQKLVEWGEEEQDRAPLKQIQRLGKLMGHRRRGAGGKDTEDE